MKIQEIDGLEGALAGLAELNSGTRRETARLQEQNHALTEICVLLFHKMRGRFLAEDTERDFAAQLERIRPGVTKR